MIEHFPAWGSFVIAVIVFIFTGIGTAIRVSFIVSGFKDQLEQKIAEEITRVREENDEKRSRMYARLDEHKQFVEGTFVRRDMCSLLHDGTAKAISRVEVQVEAMNKKIDDLKTLFIAGGKQ